MITITMLRRSRVQLNCLKKWSSSLLSIAPRHWLKTRMEASLVLALEQSRHPVSCERQSSLITCQQEVRTQQLTVCKTITTVGLRIQASLSQWKSRRKPKVNSAKNTSYTLLMSHQSSWCLKRAKTSRQSLTKTHWTLGLRRKMRCAAYHSMSLARKSKACSTQTKIARQSL